MWFKSKIQHPDPAMRRQYVEGLAPEDPVLTEVAVTDPHPDVRCAALSRIADLETLYRLGRNDDDEQVRGLATARLHSLISGHEGGSPGLDARLAFAADFGDDRLVRYLARSGLEPELRRFAVQRLLQQADDNAVQDLLCDIAGSDPISEIREAAAEPIHDAARLQKLLDESRSRDKRIHRLARERLDALHAQQDAADGLEKTADQLQRLAESHFSDDGKTEAGRLAVLSEDWDRYGAIAGSVDDGLQQRFESARAQVEARLQALNELLQHRDGIMAALRAHLDDQPAETVSELIRRWHELGEPTPAQERDFDKLVRQVTEHDSRRDRDEQRIREKRDILDAFESAAQAKSLSRKDLARLEARWETANDPEDGDVAKALQESFLSQREKLRARLAGQEKSLEEDIAGVASLLEQYETSLESGKLREAVSAHDKAVSAMSRLDVPDQRLKKLQQRLRSSEPRMAELKRWRHWGTDRKREELCDKAEALATAEMKIPDVAKAVREYRNQWKALDKSDGPAAKKLWQRFDTACEKAYEPCQAFFDEQKSQRQQNMSARIAICEELEALAANTDWESPPWRELADTMKAIQQKWHKAGSVDRREKRKIQARFDQAKAAVDEHLGVMRKREVDRREALIAKVESLAEVEDTRQAIDVARDAQKHWKPLVQAGRRKEQQLWKRFRAACDAVFDRRKEQFAQADQERRQNLAEKLAVHGQLEEMATELRRQLEAGEADADSIRGAKKKARQLASGWRRIGPIPRDKAQSVERQFRDSCAGIERLCAQLERRLAREAIRTLRDTAAHCDGLELSAAGDGGVDAAAVEEALGRTNGIDDDGELEERLQRLRAVASGDSAAVQRIRESLAENVDRKRRLCLEMEIAAGIDSPEDCREERMQYRVTQLSESMSGNRKSLEPAELERRWYLSGAIPDDVRPELEQRFQRALEALSDG